MSLLQTFAVALLAGAAGGAVATALRSWVKRRGRSDHQGDSLGDQGLKRIQKGVDDSVALVRSDLTRLTELVNRVHQDLTEVMRSPRLPDRGGDHTAQPQRHPEPRRPLTGLEPQRRPGLDPVTEGSRPYGERYPAPRNDPASPPRDDRHESYRAEGTAGTIIPDPSYGWATTGAAGETRGSGSFGASGIGGGGGAGGRGDLPLMDDPYATGGGDARDFQPASSGPPPNAVLVEARDDRIISSSSYPPEAWLEPGSGPTERRVFLNAAVALNEYALRRLSTFFRWEGERAGSRYQTESPAVIRWDDGQQVGTLKERGTARPR